MAHPLQILMQFLIGHVYQRDRLSRHARYGLTEVGERLLRRADPV
jgi:hypothetical protein